MAAMGILGKHTLSKKEHEDDFHPMVTLTKPIRERSVRHSGMLMTGRICPSPSAKRKVLRLMGLMLCERKRPQILKVH
jgi:hypothetical protein